MGVRDAVRRSDRGALVVVALVFLFFAACTAVAVYIN